MTYKIIAIGILALLALSSVMNPKAFRLLAGAIAVAAITLVTGYFVLASVPPIENANQSNVARALSNLSRFVNGQPNWNDAARSTSQRILEGFEDDLVEADPIDDLLDKQPPQQLDRPRRDRIIVVERHAIESDTTERVEQQVGAKILAIVGQYLKEFKKRHTSPQVARLKATDLNLTLLKFRPKRGKNGEKEYTVVFDEGFNQHVLIRARQLTVRDRLVVTTYGCMGIGVVVLLLFGVLKVINSRRRVLPEKDLLRLSKISSV